MSWDISNILFSVEHLWHGLSTALQKNMLLLFQFPCNISYIDMWRKRKHPHIRQKQKSERLVIGWGNRVGTVHFLLSNPEPKAWAFKAINNIEQNFFCPFNWFNLHLISVRGSKGLAALRGRSSHHFLRSPCRLHSSELSKCLILSNAASLSPVIPRIPRKVLLTNNSSTVCSTDTETFKRL